jgi:thiol-disulfide isomerase/thioredoxin
MSGTMKKLALLVFLFLLLSCSGKKGNDSLQDGRQTSPVHSRKASQNVENRPAGRTEAPKSFTMPEIPPMLVEPGSRTLYLLNHFWDNFDFSDTSYIGLKEITERAFIHYAQMLSQRDVVPYDKAVEGMLIMLNKAQADSSMYRYFTGLCKKYFYRGNSPMMNDEYYIPVLEHMLQSPHLAPASKKAAELDLKRLKRNLPGQSAENFDYTLHSGKTQTLYQLKAEYILLFFNNPDCPACKEVQEQISASPLLSKLIQKGSIKVLALYPDSDLAAWDKHREQIPSAWINAYDKDQRITLDELYDLKAIPMLYLLDGQKKVLIRDGKVKQVEQLLSAIIQQE